MFINQGSLGTLNFNAFLHQLVKQKNVEKSAAFSNKQKNDTFFKEMVCCRKFVAIIKSLSLSII